MVGLIFIHEKCINVAYDTSQPHFSRVCCGHFTIPVKKSSKRSKILKGKYNY